MNLPANLPASKQLQKSTRPFYLDPFLWGMILAVTLASLFPEYGQTGGVLHADVLANIGVAAIFFLHGVGLSTESLKTGFMNWKLHVFIQLFCFAVFPLLWVLLNGVFGSWLPNSLNLGFFYLCSLPSTITSSVAMTAMARGNVSAAIFNATLSTLLGIFLTPLLVSLLLNTTSEGLQLTDAILNIAKLLVVPFIAGQLLKPLIGRWLAQYKRYTSSFDRLVILLLVYASFCDSVQSGLWTRYGYGVLLITLVGTALILAIVLVVTTWLARRLQFSREDEITAVFCGSKKTLASGIPMAKLLFGAHPGLGLIVLPIMFYHQLQLAVCTILAGRYARNPAKPDPIRIVAP